MWFVKCKHGVPILLSLGCLLVGCGDSSGRVPVKGKVTLDGQPLEKVQVVFFVEGGGPETNFVAVTDSAGEFELKPLTQDGGAGVAPGKYQVTLSTAFAGPELLETDPIPPERVPRKFLRQEYEVPASGLEEIHFDLVSS